MKRIYSIDFMRGLVMIIMTLDHVRDLMHTTAISQSPTDLSTTTPALFFTRWITHLCAPAFVFLSGVSAFISMHDKKDSKSTRKFLLTRGLWLLVMEFTLVNFGIWFDIHFNVFMFEVIAAIGFGFIVLSFLLNIKPQTIGIIGLAIIFLHNLAPLVPAAETSLFKKISMPFFAPAAFPLGNDRLFIVGYPPIPWLGILLAGFATGKFFFLEGPKRKSLFAKIGLAAIALFIVTRMPNIYGDTSAWSQQKNTLYTLMSFINVTKYPPSLDFILLFLGFMFLIISAAEGVKNKFTDIAGVYGKTPLFYFILHWYVIHPLMFVIAFLQGFKSSDLVFGTNLGRPKAGSGVELGLIYLIWISVIILFYPLCKWYGNYKIKHKEKKWLRYL
ncbi:MAG TPA: heparan-alpha-glucosaminide N-acetyltransferase domain-containing protein [Chitinophagaceae bacterium]|nr:heparan-alpha-glucosaminide N-acetyltransferase domain-containing protein [Chitinophagaceae bacterium]